LGCARVDSQRLPSGAQRWNPEGPAPGLLPQHATTAAGPALRLLELGAICPDKAAQMSLRQRLAAARPPAGVELSTGAPGTQAPAPRVRAHSGD
jgi:hypothetical protein